MATVSVEQLRRTTDPQELGCSTSADMQRLETIVGQRRAIRALQFGLGIQELGFNIYVAGLPGTGRTTAVKRFLEEIARDKPVPGDLCYVNNFQDLYRPQALTLPPGHAREFQADMRALVEEVAGEIRRAFESEEYALRRDETGRKFSRKRNDLFAQLNDKARQESFALQMSPIGLVTIPLKDGEPLDEDAFQALGAEERAAISHKQEDLQGEVKTTLRQVRGLERELNEELSRLDQEVALYTLGPLIEELKEKVLLAQQNHSSDVVAYLDEVRGDILQNLSQFRAEPQDNQPARQPITSLLAQQGSELFLRRYEVNVLVDHAELEGAPVVIELNPTYNNLFGWTEKEPQFGTLTTDFTMIRSGSLHRANGGYLVLPAPELLRNGLSWDTLKRSLRNRQATVEEPAERLGFMAAKTLRPEPVPLDVKVILIGDPRLYQLLYAYDEDFGELFKVKADFDTDMQHTEENVNNYAAFVCTLCCEEDLKHLDQGALAQVIEYSSRLANDQHKLSTQFGAIADVIREASFYARQDDADYTNAAHIKKAIDERFYRSNLVQERIREMIARGTIMIDVQGEQVGQVNGLSVIGLGDIAFGRPSRITATTGLGRGGLVDIEREANLGGPTHTKGVMILSGYLADRYARDKPLSLSARLAFEQSYSGVDGDSASSTELYAILSSLSGVPIQQGIAVTGSVNQKGQVQAIGGVNEKIEGFYEVCKAKGLTGEQGVMIPESNVPNLMLQDQVVDAVREGRFHIWSVRTIDEGIEILTGVKAGQRQEDGTFEEGTINDRVDRRLREFAETMARFSAGRDTPLPRSAD